MLELGTTPAGVPNRTSSRTVYRSPLSWQTSSRGASRARVSRHRSISGGAVGCGPCKGTPHADHRGCGDGGQGQGASRQGSMSTRTRWIAGQMRVQSIPTVYAVLAGPARRRVPGAPCRGGSESKEPSSTGGRGSGGRDGGLGEALEGRPRRCCCGQGAAADAAPDPSPQFWVREPRRQRRGRPMAGSWRARRQCGRRQLDQAEYPCLPRRPPRSQALRRLEAAKGPDQNSPERPRRCRPRDRTAREGRCRPFRSPGAIRPRPGASGPPAETEAAVEELLELFRR